MKNQTYHFNIGVDIATQKFDISFSDQGVTFLKTTRLRLKRLWQKIKKVPNPRSHEGSRQP
ncbi:MAG: hypothetical protein Q7U18_01165 [Methylobacter sp.]|nr:hypothetical protein [Methylobacter sp.]